MGWSNIAGPWAHAEAGWKPLRNLGAYTYAHWTKAETVAGVGVRLEF